MPNVETTNAGPNPPATPRLGGRRWLLIALVLLVAWPRSAVAGGRDQFQARTLFARGLAAMHGKRFDEACPMLAKSYALESTMGVLITLAECEVGRGDHAKALRHYREYLEAFVRLPPQERWRRQRRYEAASAQVTALERLVAWLTIAVPTPNLESLHVRHNGAIVEPALWGVMTPVAPGKHRVSVTHQSRTRSVTYTLAKGERRVVVMDLEATPQAPNTNNPSDSNGPGATANNDGGAQRKMAMVAGTVGALGVLASGVAGGLALSEKSVINEHCNGGACDTAGKEAGDRARRSAMVSNITLGIGASALIGGAILWLTAEPDEPEAVTHSVWSPWVNSDGSAGFNARITW